MTVIMSNSLLNIAFVDNIKPGTLELKKSSDWDTLPP